MCKSKEIQKKQVNYEYTFALFIELIRLFDYSFVGGLVCADKMNCESVSSRWVILIDASNTSNYGNWNLSEKIIA